MPPRNETPNDSRIGAAPKRGLIETWLTGSPEIPRQRKFTTDHAPVLVKLHRD
jgi:hypothetical protein